MDCVFAYDANFFFHVTCSCITLRYFLLSRALFSTVFLYFFSLSLSQFSFLLMAPKNSIPSKNSIRCCGSSSSSSSYVPSIPDSMRFHDEKARDDFFENFFEWGIHSEC